MMGDRGKENHRCSTGISTYGHIVAGISTHWRPEGMQKKPLGGKSYFTQAQAKKIVKGSILEAAIAVRLGGRSLELTIRKGAKKERTGSIARSKKGLRGPLLLSLKKFPHSFSAKGNEDESARSSHPLIGGRQNSVRREL